MRKVVRGTETHNGHFSVKFYKKIWQRHVIMYQVIETIVETIKTTFDFKRQWL